MNRNKRIRPRRRNGLLALSPMLVMAACFVVLSFVCGGFSQVPILIVFLLVAAYALLTLRGWSVEERLRVFSRGAGQADLLLMVLIFVLAGGFAATAKAMGAIDATVGLCLSVLPPRLLLPGMFTAACLVSLSVGSTVPASPCASTARRTAGRWCPRDARLHILLQSLALFRGMA